MKTRYVTAAATLMISFMSVCGQTYKSAEEVFEEIARSCGKHFIYQADLLKGLKVKADLNGKNLAQTLDAIFEGTDVSYRIKGDNIMLYRVKRALQPEYITVSGFVREAGSGEALAGALVTVPGTKTATVANSMGYYSLTVPREEAIQISASFPGFSSNTSTLGVVGSVRHDFNLAEAPEMLQGIEVIGSTNHISSTESAAIGTHKVSRSAILSTPTLFGESDVIKTLQLEPGVSAGKEGMAGMYVHGGNNDENMYMLDNIPLYQVNHLGGLFSAFNSEALRNVDFYKSSFPAKYDGRLSSYMDVNTKDGSLKEHHGAVKLGLTSGAFNIDGPIVKDRTSYSFAIRRSWFDLLTLSGFAIYNASSANEKNSVGYAFTDVNAKITHRFNKRSTAYVMAYYGEDYLRVKETWDKNRPDGDYEEMYNNMRWGNLVASAGWNYVFSGRLFGEFTGAFSQYRSRLRHSDELGTKVGGEITQFTIDKVNSDNKISDAIFRADFDYHPHSAHKINFGASYTYHNFMPMRTSHTLISETAIGEAHGMEANYHANEANAYVSDDWNLSSVRINYGAHLSLFNIGGHTHFNASPRLAVRWKPSEDWALKAGYSRTVQYVHQLQQSSISLPVDQWVPIMADQKAQTADKVSVGAYFSPGRIFTFSLEAYYKRMHNLLDYADNYYLVAPEDGLEARLVAGKGWAKGIDFKVSKDLGALTGHVAYSLLWADRQFDAKNGGRPFPARFDNRHKINVLVNWKINSKWSVSAAWTGMSGNRMTLSTQCWADPGLTQWHGVMNLPAEVNNFRMPFFHRLDLSAQRNTRRGYWTFSVYNAYCHMNTILVEKAHSEKYTDYRPVYRKVKFLPIIPSISYTWKF